MRFMELKKEGGDRKSKFARRTLKAGDRSPPAKQQPGQSRSCIMMFVGSREKQDDQKKRKKNR
jgi:hypothetical protein